MSSRPALVAFLRVVVCLLLLGGLAAIDGGVFARAAASGHPPRQSRDAVERPRGAEPVRFELANGLRVWVQVDRRRPVVSVATLYKVGWLHEGPGTTGLAHYVEHMVFRATENIRNEDIYGLVDRIGGRWTGGTGPLGTSYGETVPSWALEDVLHIGAERMARAVFDEAEFERERSNVVTEVNGYVASGPLEVLREQVMLASFEVHPWRHDSGTWARDNLTVGRDEAFDFYKDYYGPNNTVLAIVGDVDIEETRDLVEKHYAPLAPAPRSGEVLLVEPPQRLEKRVTLTHPGERQHLEIVYRSPHTVHPDYPTLVVVDRLLSGRLERAGATAGAESVSTSYRPGPYPYVYRISVTTDESADLERLLETVQAEIDRLASEPLTAEDLDAARASEGHGDERDNAQEGQELPPRDAPPSLAAMASALTAGETFPWEVGPERLERIRQAEARVTPADIRSYVDRWLRPSRRTAGFHVVDDSDFVPEWTDGTPMVGARLRIPPLTVAPAPRERPLPVPDRALEPLPDLEMQTARRELPGGLVIRAARREGETAALHLRLELGNAPDPPGREGLALLAARTVAGDPRLLARIEELGAEINDTARTDPSSLANHGYVDVRARFLASDTGAAVEAIAGALGAGSWSAERVEQEREALVAEIVAADEPGALPAAEIARRHLLPTVAPGWRTGIPATVDGLARITAADVNAYLADRLRGDAMVVSLVGPGDPQDLLEVAADTLAALPEDGPAAAPPAHSVRSTRRDPAREQRIAVADEPQVTVVAALPGVPRDHPDVRALQLLDTVVGLPSYGGRLGWALTKGGLTYSSAAASTSGASAGYILLSTKCDTANLEATLQAIREVVAGLGADGVREWEHREAQAVALGRTLLYAPGPDSDEQAIAEALVDSETLGEELLDRPGLSRAVLGITHEQLDAAARRSYRPELLRVVAIGAIPDEAQESVFPAGTFQALFEQ